MRPKSTTITMLLLAVSTSTFADDQPDASVNLRPVEQAIEVTVSVPSNTYSFTVTGECAVGNQAMDAEAYDADGIGFNVEKDVYSGLTIYFSNNEDEWELIVDPPEDTSELEGNRFRFSGAVPRNFEESDKQPLSIEVVCTAS